MGNQSAHIGMLTEVIEGMQVADKERGEELRQLRAIVAAQQQQLDAGAVQWRSDPGLLAEQPAGSSIEGRDEAQAAAPAQIEGRDEAQAAAPVSAARNGAPTACRRHESETGERVSAPLRNPRGLHCGKNLCGAFEAATVEAGAGRNGAAAGGDGAAAGTSRGVVVATRLEGLRSGAAATRPAGEAAASVAQKSLSSSSATPTWAVESTSALGADRQPASFGCKVPGSFSFVVPVVVAGEDGASASARGLQGAVRRAEAAARAPMAQAGERTSGGRQGGGRTQPMTPGPRNVRPLSALCALQARAQEEQVGRSQAQPAGRPPGPSVFRLPPPPTVWLRRPYNRNEYSMLHSMLSETEADPCTHRGSVQG